MLEIISPALLIGFLIALSHGLLGIKVLDRGIIFIDLAIAQIAGLGLIAGQLFWPEHHWIPQITALACALSAGLFFYYIEKRAPDLQEAIIGSSFVLAASCCILLLTNHAHGSDEITNLLSGQILFVTFSDILKHAPIYFAIIAIWLAMPKIREGVGFYLIFAIAVTSSVQLVGIHVVFASLIMPAIAAKGHKSPVIVAWICGTLSVAAGIFAAMIFDLPAGSLIVISYTIIVLAIRLNTRFIKWVTQQ